MKIDDKKIAVGYLDESDIIEYAKYLKDNIYFNYDIDINDNDFKIECFLFNKKEAFIYNNYFDYSISSIHEKNESEINKLLKLSERKSIIYCIVINDYVSEYTIQREIFLHERDKI